MINEFMDTYSNQITSLYYVILFINAILHIIFAGAVAKDAGKLEKLGQRTCLVSAHTWAFAVLVGGVFTAVVYWILHHSALLRNKSI